jgi:hypothetical protein
MVRTIRDRENLQVVFGLREERQSATASLSLTKRLGYIKGKAVTFIIAVQDRRPTAVYRSAVGSADGLVFKKSAATIIVQF